MNNKKNQLKTKGNFNNLIDLLTFLMLCNKILTIFLFVYIFYELIIHY